MSAQQIERIEAREPAPAPVASEASAMVSMIERAARDPNVDVEKFERLMLMKERVEAEAARKAFNAAVAEAKGQIGLIAKNAKGHNDKAYADFASIARTVDPVLAKLGLTYRFRTTQTDRINVTCVLSHRDGHSEETTLAGPPDASGSKNAIQAIGSTLTYLQRYSLVQMLGLAAGKDDDGHTAMDVSAEDLLAAGKAAAAAGMVDLGDWWKRLTPQQRRDLGPQTLADLKAIAQGGA